MPQLTFVADTIISLAYDQYSDDLFRHCRYRRFEPEDAEEVVQEVFLSVWLYLKEGNDIENMRAFLYKVTNNLIVDRVRKRKIERKISLDEMQEKGIELKEPRNEVRSSQQRIDVRSLLQKLYSQGSMEDHKLLSMRYFDGLMPADIASRMGIAPNTISVRLHRALKKVSTFLETH
jgi:RNA polymerase sigma factor (sigma-70 family)